MIIAASMAYFGMDTVDSMPTENKIPRKLEKASKESRESDSMDTLVTCFINMLWMVSLTSIRCGRRYRMQGIVKYFLVVILYAQGHLSMGNAE